MLYFVYTELALGYLFFSFVSALGILQFVAARYRLAGLALLDYSERRTWGYALGTLFVLGSGMWFFASQWPRILTPGPAGAELGLLFGVAAVCALAATLVLAALRQRTRQVAATQMPDDSDQTVAIGRATGRLYVPANPTAPMPALCLVPGPDGFDQASWNTLARQIVEQGMVVLLVIPERESYTYPEILATLPAATSLLSKRPEVDPERIGALGHDLGGDLVIRAASADKQLKTVVALAPILDQSALGVDLMSEMPYPQALRWACNRQRAKLQNELNALEYAAKIAPRPLLLLYGTEDRMVPHALPEEGPAEDSLLHPLNQDSITLQVVPGAGHLNLLDHPVTLHAVFQWFGEHL